MRLIPMPGVAEFARRRKSTKRKPLSASHRQKISRSLKGKKRTKSRDDRVLAIRESEARSRSVRNVGYVTNSVTDAVREGRQVAKWFGITPSNVKRVRGLGSGLRAAEGYAKPAGNIARSIGAIGKLF